MSKKHYADRNLKFETLQLHVGQETPDPVTDARAVPIYLTSSYVFHNSEHAADRFGLRDAGNIYGRLTNPTEDVFERRIAALEGGVAALAVGSGAAALTYAFQAVAHAGDHIVAAKNIYGGTYNLLAHTLPDYGIEATFVDPFDYDGIKAAIKENTKAIEIETLGNPNSEVVDIEKIANIAHEAGIPLIVDNTFATPYLVRPIEYGADIVVHSATKFIGGHGTTIGGVIIDSGKFDWTQNDKWPWLVEPNVSYHGVSFAKDCAPAAFATYIRAILLRDTGATIGGVIIDSGKFDWTQNDKWPWLVEPNVSYHGVSFAKDCAPAAFATYIRAILLRDTGATISPVHSFIFLQGLETLSLRVERHVENALKVVQYLKDQPLVEKVNHPSISEDKEQQELYKKYFPNGGGSIFTFEIKGGAKEAQKFIDNLELFSLLANVADVKSLAIHPASTTHSECNEAELLDQGIKPNTIRLSIGTENVDDIIEDLDEAFKALAE
jgi:O-acetylhomoserine (thiol)-lyase